MPSESSKQTYTLEDLERWRPNGTSLAVVGHPVQHSISPQMHNAAIAELAAADSRFANWTYYRFDIEPDALSTALPLFHEKKFFGLNLTVPHKEIAFGEIESIDPHAQRIGAVNTLKATASGYRGFNTDGYGLSQGLRSTIERSITDSDIVLLGAGGAARAAAIQCLAESCRSLTILNRNQSRLGKLIEELASFAAEQSIPLQYGAPADASELPENAIVVNATSLGLKSDDPLPIPSENLPRSYALYDMIYNPVETQLMAQARSNGCATANGLSMLIHQGARALEIWSGSTPSPHTMERAARAALNL